MIVFYKVHYWDEIDHEPKTEKGLVNSNTTIGSAVDRVCEFYGKDNIVSIEVYETEDVVSEGEISEMFST